MMTFLVFRLVELGDQMRTHLENFTSHKDVKSDSKLGNEWLVKELKVKEDTLTLVWNILTPCN